MQESMVELTKEDCLYGLFAAGQITLSEYLETFDNYKIYQNMIVTELGDCTVVIEKEDDDSVDFTVGSMFKEKKTPKVGIFVPNRSWEVYKAKEYIVNEDILIVYLDSVPPEINVGTHIGVKVGMDWYETVFDRSKALT